jgi:hypothetical protein
MNIVLSLVSGMALGVYTPSAHAAEPAAGSLAPSLSCGDLLGMAQSATVGQVVDAIRGSAPGYSPADVACLQQGGAPAEVVAAVRGRLGLPAEAGPRGGEGRAQRSGGRGQRPEGAHGQRGGEDRGPQSGSEPWKFGGDFQTNFVAEHLERGGDPAFAGNPPRPTFTVAHLRPRVDFEATDWLSLRAAMEFAAYPDSPPIDPEILGDTLAVAGSDESILDPSVDEMFLRLHTGKNLRTTLRMGVLHTPFGLRDAYDQYDAFFLGGQLAYMEPERRFGISPGIDLGVGWRLAWKDMAALDLQLVNGSGVTRLDSTSSKDLIARVTLAPVSMVELRGSVMHAGTKDDGHTHGAFSVELNAKSLLPSVAPRIVAEGVLSRVSVGGYDTDRLAWLVAAAADVPVQTRLTDHVSVIASLSGFDPDFVASSVDVAPVYDQNWYIDAGANLYWNTEGPQRAGGEGGKQRGRGVTAFTGLTFEQMIPENADLPVSNSITVHCGLSR